MTTTIEHIDTDGLDKCCLTTIIQYPEDATEGVLLGCQRCTTTVTYVDLKWRQQKKE